MEVQTASQEGSGKEQEVAQRYNQLQQETQALLSKMLEIEDEKKEHELVIETIKDLEPDRKCWRLLNGVLMEKRKEDLHQELITITANMKDVIKQLTEAIDKKKEEISMLEKTYENIMKQAQEAKREQVSNEGGATKSGGIVA